VRKVEIYANGKMGYASRTASEGGSRLSNEPLPSIKEIAQDPQFYPCEIDEMEFEKVWVQAHGYKSPD
jgi:hypothetical protein